MKKTIGIYPWVNLVNDKGDKHQTLFSDALFQKGYEIKKIIYKKGFPISHALKKDIDILILDWVHSFYISQSILQTLIKSTLGLIELLFLNKRKTKIIWNLHNLQRHDGKFKLIEKFCFQQLAKKVNYIRVFDKSQIEKVSTHLKISSGKIIAIPQGPYIFKENKEVNLKYRYQISKEKKILLFFGSIRKGKGLVEFLKSFKQVENNKWVLLIAGKSIEKDLENEIDNMINLNKNIIFDNRYIPDEEVKSYFEEADRLLLPYVNSLNSGILLLGNIYNTLILANSNFSKLVKSEDVVGDLFNPIKLEELLTQSEENKGGQNEKIINSWDNIIENFVEYFNE